MAFGEWKWITELLDMARVTAVVRFDEIQLKNYEEVFWRWATRARWFDRIQHDCLTIILCDLQRGEALVKASFDAWAMLICHKTLTKAAFRAWARETNPPYELDWDVIEAGGAGLVYTADGGWQTRPGITALELMAYWDTRHKAQQHYVRRTGRRLTKTAFKEWKAARLFWADDYHCQRLVKAVFAAWVSAEKPPLQLTQQQVLQLGFRELDLETTERIGMHWQKLVPIGSTEEWQTKSCSESEGNSGSEAEENGALPRLPDRSGNFVGWGAWYGESDYTTDHWSPKGPTSPYGHYAPAGLKQYALTVPTPAGTFDGNEAQEGLIPLPQRLHRIQKQRCRRELRAWRQVLHKRKQQAAGDGDSTDDQYDGDSDGDSGGDSSDSDDAGDDQH